MQDVTHKPNSTSRYLAFLLKRLEVHHVCDWGIFFRYTSFTRSIHSGKLRGTPTGKLVSEAIHIVSPQQLRKPRSEHLELTQQISNGGLFYYTTSKEQKPWVCINSRRPETHKREEDDGYTSLLPNSPFIVDYPIYRGSELIGVLAAGYPYAPETTTVLKVLDHLTRTSVNTLTGLRGRIPMSSSDIIKSIARSVNNASTIEDLYRICTVEVPEALFGAANASIFTPTEDDSGQIHLILRSSSHHEACLLENRESYEISDTLRQGLTQWVANNHASLRVTLPLDDEQKNRVNPNLEWANQIKDAASHKNYMACPILSPITGFHGVLRIVDREFPFTEIEEIMLRILCEDHLAPKLHALRHSDVTEGVLMYLRESKINTIALAHLDENEFCQKTCEKLYQRFAQRARGGLHGASRSGMGKIILGSSSI